MMNPDSWWNRTFPAYSRRRLAFGLLAVPVVALLVALLRRAIAGAGAEVTLAELAFVTLTGQGVVVVGWILAREDREPTQGDIASQRPWWRPDQPQDFLFATAIAFIGFSVLLASMMSGDESSTWTVVMPLVTAVGFSSVLLARFSMWTLVAIAVVAGYPIGAIAYMFFFWLGGGDSVVGYWVVGSLVAFVFMAPIWFRMRAMRHVLERIPLWVMSLIVTVPLGLMGALVAAADVEADPSARGFASGPGADSLPAGFGRPTREQASVELLNAWRANDRVAARDVARPGAIEDLLGDDFHPTTVFGGCGLVPEGLVNCTLAVPRGLMLLTMQTTTEGAFYIDDVERVPSSYPIEYNTTGAGSP